jgi:hypothetical protein
MISAEWPDHVGEQDDIPLVPGTTFWALIDIVIAFQTRSALALRLRDRANPVPASSQCRPPNLQKVRVTDISRALRIREELKAGLYSPCQHAAVTDRASPLIVEPKVPFR